MGALAKIAQISPYSRPMSSPASLLDARIAL